jgi:hypothetical protein
MHRFSETAAEKLREKVPSDGIRKDPKVPSDGIRGSESTIGRDPDGIRQKSTIGRDPKKYHRTGIPPAPKLSQRAGRRQEVAERGLTYHRTGIQGSAGKVLSDGDPPEKYYRTGIRRKSTIGRGSGSTIGRNPEEKYHRTGIPGTKVPSDGDPAEGKYHRTGSGDPETADKSTIGRGSRDPGIPLKESTIGRGSEGKYHRTGIQPEGKYHRTGIQLTHRTGIQLDGDPELIPGSRGIPLRQSHRNPLPAAVVGIPG